MSDPFAIITAGNLNNEAIALEQAGNYAAAEKKYLECVFSLSPNALFHKSFEGFQSKSSRNGQVNPFAVLWN
jgi:hypothetical protein